MSINSIKININGYVSAKSDFYCVEDVLPNDEVALQNGVNMLEGGIDSGVFAVSYLISMYPKVNHRLLFSTPEALVDGVRVPLSKLAKRACYIDLSYPLFSSKKTVRTLVTLGLKKSKLRYSADEICEIFKMTPFRFDRPISGTGNERFKAMSAIGFSYGKEIFCFPWFSKYRYDRFKIHMKHLNDTLSSLGKMVIFPTESISDI